MVQFQKGKLIIEIPCGQQNPLQLLTDYQMGIISALHAFGCVDLSALSNDVNNDLNLQNSMYKLTSLLHQLMFSLDQSDKVGEVLFEDKKALEYINEYGKTA